MARKRPISYGSEPLSYADTLSFSPQSKADWQRVLDAQKAELAGLQKATPRGRFNQDNAELISNLQKQIAASETNLKNYGLSRSDIYYRDSGKERPTLTPEQIAQGYQLMDQGGSKFNIGGYEGEKIAPPKPGKDYVYNYRDNKWYYQAPDSGGLFGGMVDNLTPSFMQGNALGDLLTAPNRSIASQLDNVSSGANVGKTLADDLAISQGAITGAIDSAGGRAGQAIADYGRRLTEAEGSNLRQQGEGAEAISQGDVSRGMNTMEEAGREFARDPAVAPLLAAAATYLGQGYLAPMLSGVAGAAGAGAASGAIGGAAAGAATGAGISAGMGESNIGDAALSGAVAGGIGGAGNWAKGLTDSAAVNAAIQGAGNQAIGTGLMGGNRDEILQAAQTGAIAGGLRPILGEVGQEYGKAASGMLGGAISGAMKDGSQGAEYGAILGGLKGLGAEYGGGVGAALGGLVAKDYIQGQVQEDRQAQMQQLAAQRRQQMLADPRYQKYLAYQKAKADPRYAQYQQYLKQKQGGGMMTGRPAGNSALSRLTPQQLQQMYAQYKARRA